MEPALGVFFVFAGLQAIKLILLGGDKIETVGSRHLETSTERMDWKSRP